VPLAERDRLLEEYPGFPGGTRLVRNLTGYAVKLRYMLVRKPYNRWKIHLLGGSSVCDPLSLIFDLHGERSERLLLDWFPSESDDKCHVVSLNMVSLLQCMKENLQNLRHNHGIPTQECRR
jgi:hypothetical protein